jgi:hypothetical protein
MPFWAERTGVPRTLAVEFPFGHMLGQVHNVAQQTRIVTQALDVMVMAQEPGLIVHAEEKWPGPTKEAIEHWQPKEPSPVVEVMAPAVKEMLRQSRRNRKRGN